MKSKQDYFLNIHHRNIAVQEGKTGELEQIKSHGHFFISLETNNVDPSFFGRYPVDSNGMGLLIGFGVVETNKEKEIHKGIDKKSKETGEDYISTKKIRLTDIQYNKALEYAMSTVKDSIGKNDYIVGIADCTDFVQSVYNSAGLPLYFTSVYTKSELLDLDTLAAKSVFMKYGSKDTFKDHFSKITGISKEQLASSLNINVEKIKMHQASIDLSLESHVSILPTFEVLIEESDLSLIEKMSKLLIIKEDNTTKIKLLQDKVQELNYNYIQKINIAYKQFVENKKKENDSLDKELEAQSEAEKEECCKQYDVEYAKTFSRLSSELQIETQNKFSMAKAMVDNRNALGTSQGGITSVDNHDIAAIKQKELHDFSTQHHEKGKINLAAIHQKYVDIMKKEFEEMNLLIDKAKSFIENNMVEFLQKIKTEFIKTKELIEKGEDVDIDNVINHIEELISLNLSNVQEAINQTSTIAYVVSDIIYDNPILNHPELIKQMATKFGSGIIDKLINFGMQFNNTEDRAMLECVCNEPNNVDNMALLIGLDISDNITYH